MTLSDLRVLYEVFNENREEIQKAIASIDNGYVSIDEISSGDYFTHSGCYYSSDDYVITYYGRLIEKDDAYYCEGSDDYYEDEDMVNVYLYKSDLMYSRRFAENNSDWWLYNDDYYDNDALSYHQLVYVEDMGEVWSEDEAYYHGDEGAYYSYAPSCEEYTRGYHDGSYKNFRFDNKSKYSIGYEIEKEDEEVLESINIEDFEEETDNKWRKERDGSLNSDTGYELISPTFEFNIDKIFEHIESNDVLVKHINAEKSTSCGGHIHLSERGLSGEQLFDKVKGYTPLLYALYYGRVDKTYCKGKNNRDLKYENEKYQAIKIHHDRIEFRIISAVPDITTLKWRSKLLMMILQNPTHDIIKGYYNVDTKFTKLLKQMYSDDKLADLKERFIKFTKQFENLDIK
jgi:hypothetical protein